VNLTVTLTIDQLRGMIEQEVARAFAASGPAQGPPTEDRELLRVSEAAALVGLSPKTLYNYRSEGRLTRHGLPGAAMVSRTELLGLMEHDRLRGRG
jgi:Helix-turn-helix domain